MTMYQSYNFPVFVNEQDIHYNFTPPSHARIIVKIF